LCRSVQLFDRVILEMRVEIPSYGYLVLSVYSYIHLFIMKEIPLDLDDHIGVGISLYSEGLMLAISLSSFCD